MHAHVCEVCAGVPRNIIISVDVVWLKRGREGGRGRGRGRERKRERERVYLHYIHK